MRRAADMVSEVCEMEMNPADGGAPYETCWVDGGGYAELFKQNAERAQEASDQVAAPPIIIAVLVVASVVATLVALIYITTRKAQRS
mgnify:CR=1 FL=1